MPSSAAEISTFMWEIVSEASVREVRVSQPPVPMLSRALERRWAMRETWVGEVGGRGESRWEASQPEVASSRRSRSTRECSSRRERCCLRAVLTVWGGWM